MGMVSMATVSNRAFIFSRRSFSHLTFSAARAFSSTTSAATSSAGARAAARPSPMACSSATQSRPLCLQGSVRDVRGCERL